MHSLAAILVSGSILAPVFPVEFRILPAQEQGRASGATTTPIVQEPLANPGSPPPIAGPRPAPSASPRPTAPAPRPYPVSQGFGNDVPLSFAARQIVPAGIEVVFASDADRGASVTWQGGGPWNRTLQAAIRPLGLQMTYAAQRVTISR